MASQLCGQQYSGKDCQCRLQVTPSSSSAANPQRICAFLQDGVQYPCDPGCCDTDCTQLTSSTSTAATSTTIDWFGLNWWVIVVSIIFGLILFGSFVYDATRKK